MKQYEIRLTGSGGQGLITGGIILAEAAILDGKNALQSQSYGPEARGGASKAEVIISDKEIVFPKITECDLLLALTNVACKKYLKSLKKGGILVIDSSVDKPDRDDITVYQIPIIETANEKLKKSMVANIVALGALNKILNLVSEKSLENAVLDRVPKGTEELNRNALIEGRNLIV
ncbi:2-oxoacid:ferredoxin oxidoreductase subunit gamma [Soehngenia longivitae]|jgi:2-oxoglutarate ferredoxin oxidoreductase subunit gamma|uniref:2-oxoacid:ferredoxin oxidoreductase subunit gamma n=1 Tax=Soehngenia longivitae TaxID=2562294 RepID=A0A4Z0D5F1_9FIRM|nr:2-oxoacid:acceptor oxidoreductase family protein [Soehngenia longivitae]TFZ39773.1 2-oxoacid:ferredoxin oxidoreductase subunit gamma [Soehngenia longivitae]